MITLYAAGPAFGLPEGSPYVTKTEIHLKMAGLWYQKVPAHPATSPKGQLPWIDDDGVKVADSTFIRAYIERSYGVDLDAGLSKAQRGQAWAIERMVENHLGWASCHFRFFDDDNFAKGRPAGSTACRARRGPTPSTACSTPCGPR
jgi:glutathione S-transferase